MSMVTTQTELDAAVAAGDTNIVIDSPAGVWLAVRGSSRVVARGSSSVEAWDSSSVVAREYSSVVAREYSRVEARESSSVEARGYSSVEASKFVAVHLHSTRVKLSGTGHVIDLTKLDLNTVADWIDYHGVTVQDGKAVVFKAVDQDLNAGHEHTLTLYPVGGTVTAPDWEATQECGHGLHFGYLPSVAKGYFTGKGEPRFLAVEVPVEGLIALDDKCKAETCTVLYEVDIHGEKVAS